MVLAAYTSLKDTDLSSLSGSDTNGLSVDSTAYAVVVLDVSLGQNVFSSLGSKSAGLSKISDGRGLNYATNLEALDGLILKDLSLHILISGIYLGRKAVASVTIDTSNVTSSVLRASVISPLLCHVG